MNGKIEIHPQATHTLVNEEQQAVSAIKMDKINEIVFILCVARRDVEGEGLLDGDFKAFMIYFIKF